MGDEAEATRVDAYLWAIRLFKTRSLATDACKGGHVRVNGHPAKAATKVKVGDREFEFDVIGPLPSFVIATGGSIGVIAALMLVTYVPAFSMWLPNMILSK